MASPMKSPMPTAHRTHTPANPCRTPLHSAASRGCAEVIRLLVQGGANLDARATDGRCAGWPWPQGMPGICRWYN